MGEFLVPNYSCLQNPWLVGYRPQIPVLSVLNWTTEFVEPPRTKFLGTPLVVIVSGINNPAGTPLRRWARGRLIGLLWYDKWADRKWQWQIKLRPYINLLHCSINEDMDDVFTASLTCKSVNICDDLPLYQGSIKWPNCLGMHIKSKVHPTTGHEGPG